MPERELDAYSNPLAPEGHEVEDHRSALQSKLTNDDFRKLLMTPRATPSSAPPSKTRQHEMPREYNEDEDPAARRRKKKSYYAKLRQQEIERERELAEKYRDRARERRDGVNKDYEETELINTTANYRAESKFLGGDMEHTHLVKGLDFALLQKVRAEITSKEREEEDIIEKVQKEVKKDEDPEQKIEFKTRVGRNIYRILFKGRQIERNELFLPGRMAYVVDLEDDYADTDIPTTLIRSKADCPTMEAQTTLTTNDIVISKLTQILSYLRQGTRNKKLKKKDKGMALCSFFENIQMGIFKKMDIFDDIGDYIPSTSKSFREKEKEREKDRYREREKERDRERERDRDRDEEKRRHNYFEKPRVDEEVMDLDKGPGSVKEQIKMINEKFAGAAHLHGQEPYPSLFTGSRREEKKSLGDFFGMSNSYAECYPAT
ncbi:hypothetical protein DNTS_005596 [Danionella cerebrum]|uniref:RED-like N-terminal domain-containing protein n=1 Tax=Danionella cerebrum TaxID=2873325 RepID=A0A553REU9_9TELE|nr:hypothetical protein DNTS_005596 [Danionella translucida]